MSRSDRVRRPPQADVLYKGLFENRDDDATVSVIASGISSLYTNARRLFGDAKLLTDADRYATGTFLLCTADEEFGKLYILLDMLRLDFAKHQSVLKRLCKAFYNHLLKHAYIELTREPGVYNMLRVKQLFEMLTREYWPGNPESGEPDMPADFLLMREAGLYVDFDEFADDWFVATNDKFESDAVRGYGFGRDFARLGKLEKSVQRIERTREAGLFSVECLRLFHQVLSSTYMTCNTREKQVFAINERLFSRLETQDIYLDKSLKEDNALCGWPLYSLI